MKLILIYLLFLWFLPSILIGQNEAHYVLEVQKYIGGTTEFIVPGGRADIVNDEYAIEVEFADHWKNSIGQALWYGLQTNKKPGIVLVMRELKERKYGIMLQSAIDYAGLTDKIKVWFYPEDFGGSFESAPAAISSLTPQKTVSASGTYSMNKSSKVRHNSSCTYYNCKNCFASGSGEGKACGKCGG